MAPWVGIEPTTKRLTVACSTAELPRNVFFFRELPYINKKLRNVNHIDSRREGRIIEL